MAPTRRTTARPWKATARAGAWAERNRSRLHAVRRAGGAYEGSWAAASLPVGARHAWRVRAAEARREHAGSLRSAQPGQQRRALGRGRLGGGPAPVESVAQQLHQRPVFHLARIGIRRLGSDLRRA